MHVCGLCNNNNVCGALELVNALEDEPLPSPFFDDGYILGVRQFSPQAIVDSQDPRWAVRLSHQVASSGIPLRTFLLCADALVLRGELKGHSNWVTSIATTDVDANMIVTGSRDKTIISWKLGSDGASVRRA